MYNIIHEMKELTDIKMINCWEFNKCDKKELCPAYHNKDADGFLGGSNAGAACMFIMNTLCAKQDKISMTIYRKIVRYCRNCDYYKYQEENLEYVSYADYLEFLMEKDLI